MKVTKILVAPLNRHRLLASVSIVFDDVFKVRNIKIMPRKDGKGLFVSFPETRNNRGDYLSIAYPLTKAYREELENLILYEYDRKLIREWFKQNKKISVVQHIWSFN